uniref:Cullin family profile domain-containing protein n=1 Tax=Salix viminalis TaxID=40686 RepID=A0A6N2LAJ3_SALVM
MFTSLGIYAESFEIPFLECTSEFYAAEGMTYMQQSDVPDYLKHVESRLNEEQDRCKIYLDISTKKPLIATAERQLLERHISAILDKGFMMLMDGHRIEDLKRIYSLFLRVNALESLRQALSMYIRRTGQGLVMDEEKDKDMLRAGNKVTSEEDLEGTLEKVLGKDVFEAFYKKDLAERLLLGKSASIDAEKSMISKSRLNEEQDRCKIYLDISTKKPLIATAERQLLERHISAILDKGFMMLMDGHRIEDLKRIYSLFLRVNALESLRQALSMYIRRTGQGLVMDEEKDKDMLRAGNKVTSEEDLEGTLEKVLVLFRFIQARSCKRLLLGKSASIDAEKSMISKVKHDNFWSTCFTKYSFSINQINRFALSLQLKTECGSQYWPTYPPMDVRLPHELNVYQDIFKEFYLSKYSGRRLMWQNSLGHCVLKAEFPKGKKELAVSLFQTVVLMLFNDAQKLSFQDIKDSTGIEDKELRRTLQFLA